MLWIVGVAAVWGLGAASQERITVSAPGSRPGSLTAPALEAGPAPHHARSGWALPSCRGNHMSREVVRFRRAGPQGVLGGRGGGATCWHYRGRRGGGRGGDGGTREGEAFTLLLEQLLQSLAENPHALPGVLAHLTEGGVLWLGWGPLQPRALWPHCLSSSSRTWTRTHLLLLHLTIIPLLHYVPIDPSGIAGRKCPINQSANTSLHAEGHARAKTEGEQTKKYYASVTKGNSVSGDGTVWWRVGLAQWLSEGWIQWERASLIQEQVAMLV